MAIKNNKLLFSPLDQSISLIKYLPVKEKIVVADDDPGIRDILQIILERAGYEVELKADGQDIFKNKFSIPSLFLIDKLLSGKDGLEICKYLKMQKKTRHIPVIMISASPDIGILSKKAGADGFVEKPFEMAHLLKVIEQNIVNSHKKAAQTDQPVKK
jgi:DNA-binding response OmpR family regulator